MTRLAEIGSPTPPPPEVRLPASGATAPFNVPDAARAPSAAAQRPRSLVSLSGLIALQEAETVPDVREREARRRGRAVLEALSSLQGALLGGGDPAAAVARLDEAAAGLTECADPKLGAILTAIRLRAMVELARRGD